VPSVPHSAPIYDVRIFDDLTASAADLEFVSVARVSGSGTWTPVNTGTATHLVIEDPVNGIDIPAGEQAVIEITVRLRTRRPTWPACSSRTRPPTPTTLVDNDPASTRPGGPGTTAPMTIVEPELTLEKSGPVRMLREGPPGTFTLNVHNIGDSPAFGLVITDLLPNTASGGMCDAAPSAGHGQLFQADGTTPVGAAAHPGRRLYATASAASPPACSR
jgi:large repetitive protein